MTCGLLTQSDRTLPNALASEAAPPCVFDEAWWLKAASADRIETKTVGRGGEIVGAMATFPRRRLMFLKHHPPPYTRVMTPVVNPGAGSPESRRRRTVEIVHELVQSLGPTDSFRTVIRYDADLALAFSLNGCRLAPHFTFVSDAHVDLDDVVRGMNQKTRNLVRAGGRAVSVRFGAELSSFIRLSRVRRTRDAHDYRALRAIVAAARDRDLCTVAVATDPSGTDLAAAVLVWDRRRLYFLAGARAFTAEGNKAYAALVFEGIRFAKDRGLAFDFDGYADAARAHPLMRWGLRVESNLEIRRESRRYQALRLVHKGSV